MAFEASELLVNDDGSIFHLHLFPEDIADDIILVGDPGRVEMVASFFEKIELKRQNREFNAITGYCNKKRITVLSTGIGTDNIDIVINELDALANINLQNRTLNKTHKTLNFIRIGTSGSLQKNVSVDSFLLSTKAIGFDGLLNFYDNRNTIANLKFEDSLKKHLNWNKLLASPYVAEASESLLRKFDAEDIRKGITISAPGFYGPQGRQLRLAPVDPIINDKIESFDYRGEKITNYEMECSAIYGLSTLLGHNAVTICAIIANRITRESSKNYKPVMKKLIKRVLDELTRF